jgi:predicted nuclease of predicted toxin-antitoxin system
MKFLVDAQLPRRLARFLAEQGHDVLHTRELPVWRQFTALPRAAQDEVTNCIAFL